MSIHGGLPTTLENGSGITNKMLHFIEMPPSDDEGYFVLTKGQIIVVTEEDDIGAAENQGALMERLKNTKIEVGITLGTPYMYEIVKEASTKYSYIYTYILPKMSRGSFALGQPMPIVAFSPWYLRDDEMRACFQNRFGALQSRDSTETFASAQVLQTNKTSNPHSLQQKY
jgi:hypothetical protein